MANGLGGFLDGLVGGLNTRRQWKQQDEDRQTAEEERKFKRSLLAEQRDWTIEDRKAAAEDRLLNRKYTEEDRAETKAERRLRLERESYGFERERMAGAREDGIRDVVAGAAKDARTAYEADKAKPAPVDVPDAAAPDKKGDGSMLRSNAAATAKPAGRGILAADPKAARERASRDYMDYYAEIAAPKIRDAYLAAGDVEKAQAYDVWRQQEGVKKGMKSFGMAVHAAQVGDEEGFLDNLTAAYNNQDYYGDGMEVDRAASGFKKDKAGNIIGGQITFRNPETGETTVQDIGSETDLYRLGLGVMAPEAVYEHAMETVRGADAAAAENAKEDANLGRDMDLAAFKSMLESAGKPANEANVKRLAAIQQSLMETDMGGDGRVAFTKLPPAEQVAKALEILKAQDAAVGQGSLGSVGAAQPPVWRGN